MTDRQNGRENAPRPGLFSSGGEALVTFLIWLICLFAFAPFFGAGAHALYILLTWGWDLL